MTLEEGEFKLPIDSCIKALFIIIFLRLARREVLLNEVKWQLNGSEQLSTTIAQHWNYAKQRNQALLDVRTKLLLTSITVVSQV